MFTFIQYICFGVFSEFYWPIFPVLGTQRFYFFLFLVFGCCMYTKVCPNLIKCKVIHGRSVLWLALWLTQLDTLWGGEWGVAYQWYCCEVELDEQLHTLDKWWNLTNLINPFFYNWGAGAVEKKFYPSPQPSSTKPCGWPTDLIRLWDCLDSITMNSPW